MELAPWRILEVLREAGKRPSGCDGVGSALDIFGGSIPFEVLAANALKEILQLIIDFVKLFLIVGAFATKPLQKYIK